MKNGETLSEEDKGIIRFFYDTEKLWQEPCYAKDTEPCPNLEFCARREEHKEEVICTEFIQWLNLNAQKIVEKEIQKAILRNFPEEWCLKEKLIPIDEEKSIPEINGRIDIRLRGETNATLYIVELKLRATREHVGQLASYVGWYKKHPEEMPSPTKDVKGILLAEEFHNGALSALEVCPDLMARICRLRVDIETIQQV